MAYDGVAITEGSGETVATDLIATKQYQRIKVAWGAEGTANEVAAATPLPVGDASALTQLQAIVAALGGTLDVSGATLTINLPTGASTAANQTTIIGHVDGIETLLTTLAGAVAGTEMQVDVLTLPNVTVGVALPAGTNNIGDVDIASIAAGDNNIGNVDIASALPTGTNSIGATKDDGPQWTSVFGVSGAVVTSADASTATAVTDAPTAGQKLVLTDLIVSVGSTAMQVDCEEETSGTVFLTFYMAANSTIQITPRSKLKLPTADKKLMVDTSAAGAISVTAFYYSEA